MLIDGFGRTIDYLRVSVTERCNFRCQYCMPEKPFSWVPRENLLTFEELFKFIKVCIDEGVRKIRITGGEPTLREDLDKLIYMIASYKSDIDLALTTNGFLLAQYAARYRNAGLKRINISLDSLRPEIAAQIAQKDVLGAVLKGIEEALRVGLFVKLNMVPLKGVNDDEMVDILEFARAKGISVRYIEFMENSFANQAARGLKSSQMLEILSRRYKFKEVGREKNSPAKYYELDDGYRFGIIEPHLDDFCASCNRIRLTAEGFLIPCLYFDEAMSIKEAIRSGNIDGAAEILKSVIAKKPEKNRWGGETESSNRAFYMTGG